MNAITPLQRWKRDDWVIPCTVRDSAGQAIDLTGTFIGAEFWAAGRGVFQPLTVNNGGVIRSSDLAGQFTIIAPRKLTAEATGLFSKVVGEHTRVLIYKVDTRGLRQTLGVIPFDVFDGSEDVAISEIPQAVLVYNTTSFEIVVAASQGPAGPSSIPASQITDGTDVGRALLKALDAKTIRALLKVGSTQRVEASDVNYLVKPEDAYIAITKLTAPRTITLPPAAQYPLGQALYIADETGVCSTDTPLNITAVTGETISSQQSVIMASPYEKLAFHSNGSTLWTL